MPARFGPRPSELQRHGSTFAVGDKVMQIENDYDKVVCNGDVGFARATDPDLGDVTVEYDRWSKLDEWLAAPGR